MRMETVYLAQENLLYLLDHYEVVAPFGKLSRYQKKLLIKEAFAIAEEGRALREEVKE